MKFARPCCQLLLLALLTPGAAMALGLGDLHLKSSLNSPLDADIDLVDAEADDLSSLKATLASRDTFKRLGADYPSFLGTVTLTPEHMTDGRTVIHVHSASVADEPFATLLVEVDWARGHLVREYTVLLDPPVYNSQAASNAAVSTPAAGASARSGDVQRGSSAAAAAAAPASPDTGSGATSNGSAAPAAATSGAAAPSTDTAAAANTSPATGASSEAATPPGGASAHHESGTYTVRHGDTLSTIVAQNYGADRVARDRALVAIYRANPAAFHDNMNMLYSGSVLKLPGDSELEAIGPGEARTEVRQQYASWRGEHGGERVAGAAASDHGQLRLVAPQENAEPAAPPVAQSARNAPPGAAQGTGSSAGSSAGSAALQQRVQQLEAQLADSQRLLQLRSAELAALQARVQQGPAGGPAPGAQTPNPAATVTPPAAVPPPATVTPPAATPAPTAANPSPAAPARPHPAPGRPRVPATSAPGGSMFDGLLQYWYVPAALIAILIAVLAMRRMRSRQEDAFDRSFGQLAQPAPEPAMTTAVRTETVPVRALASRQEPSYSVEESGSHRRPMFDSDEAAASHAAEPVAMEETSPAHETPVALDQGDPLAEADFHMAYGLYDQAAELVQIAITRDPKRRDLKMKLLEVFFVWGNRERFLQTAHELAGSRDQGAAGEWEKILIMGRQIAPEDALFADSRGMAGAAKVVDLNLEGGQNRVDFDLLGEPTLATAATADGVELDLASALGEPSPTEATGEAEELESGVDFALDESERPSDATGTTREMPGALGGANDMTGLRPAPAGSGSTETMRIVTGAADSETPTVEQPQIRTGDHGTLRQKIDAAARNTLAGGEQTAELAIDDLGLDLGALAGQGDESSLPVDADAPTLLAGLDEDTRRMFEGTEETHTGEVQAAAGTDVTQRVAAPQGRPTATGTWMFTDTDFTSIAPNQKPAPTQVITQISPQIDAGSTSVALTALRGGELDLDLGSLESLKAQPGGNGIDLDVGGPSVESAHVDTQKLSRGVTVSEEGALPDLEPVTLSEVGTKLDLARAYMDMGDPEGARSILAEVMSEGSMSQKQEARRLMDALPG